ncbi:hypothetical protein [Sanguibacter massiliensis]|uniref:hypothetical protein n=1 Tax=Sanguibacter massiliensis TaxID=1973217 RepID=UPI000C842FBC|nr:hypothetical protein [Sanguibacter massiliensis]
MTSTGTGTPGTAGRVELRVVERGAIRVAGDGRVVLDPSATPDAVPVAASRPEGEQLLQRHGEGAALTR